MSGNLRNAGTQIVAETARDLIVANWATIATTEYLEANGCVGFPAPLAENIWTSERRPQGPDPFGIGIFARSGQSNVFDAMGSIQNDITLEIVLWVSDSKIVDGAWVPITDVDEFTEQQMEAALRMASQTVVNILLSPRIGFPNYAARNPGTYTGIMNAYPGTGFMPINFVEQPNDTTRTWTQQAVRGTIRVLQRVDLYLGP